MKYKMMFYEILVILLLFPNNLIKSSKSQEIPNFVIPIDYLNIITGLVQGALKELNSQNECVDQLQQWVQSLEENKLWAWKMLDAMAKPQAGILFGNIMHVGNYDECLKINVKLQQNQLQGKYCSVIFQPHPIYGATIEDPFINLMGGLSRSNDSNTIVEDGKMTYGFCVPKVCSVQDLQNITSIMEEISKSPVTFRFVEKFCDDGERLQFTYGAVFGIVIFSLFAIILFTGTMYEILFYEKDTKQKIQGKLLMAFSALTNAKKILATETSTESLKCLNGLRVISMMWIVLGHGFQRSFFLPHINAVDILEWKDQTENAFISAIAMAVDTFFTISGFLVTYLFMISRRKGVKFNAPMFYLHRILRLTPSLAMMVLLSSTLLVYMGRGPFWPIVEEMYQSRCENYWWSTLIYLENYINPHEMCVGQSWYLAVDTQMYFLSPLILLPLCRWPKQTISAIIIFIVLNVSYVFEITFKKHLGTTFFNENAEMFKLLYSPTHVRATAYLVGMICGYFAYKTSDKRIILRKTEMVVSWICSITVLLAIVIAHSKMISATEYPVLGSAFFNALTRVSWSVALSVIILLCANGYGGLINTFLSCDIFNVLIKLNYSIYLVHLNVIVLLAAQERTPSYFSNMLGFHQFWGDYCFSVATAFVWTLAFESPIIAIEKICFGTRSTAQVAKEDSKRIKTVDPNLQIMKNNGCSIQIS